MKAWRVSTSVSFGAADRTTASASSRMAANSLLAVSGPGGWASRSAIVSNCLLPLGNISFRSASWAGSMVGGPA